MAGPYFALAAMIALVATLPGPLPDLETYTNPFGIAPLGEVRGLVEAGELVMFLLMFVVLVGGGLALVARFRAAAGAERQQVKWVAWVVLLVLAGMAAAIPASLLTPNAGAVSTAVAEAALAALPIVIGLAILCYRLFDIDRIISRTIGWAIVTAILVAVFAGAVLGLQAVLAGLTQGQTLAVAASTVVAFALFAPLRRQVQQIVDRRFDRTRYAGQHVVAAFSERLREQVDLGALSAEVHRVATETVRPVSTALWLRNATHESTELIS